MDNVKACFFTEISKCLGPLASKAGFTAYIDTGLKFFWLRADYFWNYFKSYIFGVSLIFAILVPVRGKILFLLFLNLITYFSEKFF